MTTVRKGWPRGALKLIMGNAQSTQEAKPYEFEDPDAPTQPPTLSIQEWTRRCQLAFHDLEIERAGLVEARNQAVQCECRVAKAELFLERQQQGYLDCASKIPGVPCQK